MSIILDGSTGIVSDSSASNPAMTAKGNGSDVEGYIQLNCRVNSHGVKLKSPPHSSGQSYTMVLPDNQVAADKFLKVKSITGSGATAVGQLEYATVSPGITVADCWYVTSSFTNPSQNSGFIAADWSRATFGQLGNVGAAINQYGGTFSFNQTGIYLIEATVGCHITSSGVDRYVQASLLTGTGGHNGSFSGNPSSNYTNLGAGTSTTHGSVITSLIMDVTTTGAANTSVDCFRLYTGSSNSSTIIKGNSSSLQTYFTVIRLGDT